jgi:hypothetical protein
MGWGCVKIFGGISGLAVGCIGYGVSGDGCSGGSGGGGHPNGVP